jgi:hypothetical protein
MYEALLRASGKKSVKVVTAEIFIVPIENFVRLFREAKEMSDQSRAAFVGACRKRLAACLGSAGVDMDSIRPGRHLEIKE